MMRVSGLFVYPVKSCGGISLENASVVATGFAHDRRWMVVDNDQRFLSQRQCPALAQVGVRMEERSLVLSAPNVPELNLPLGRVGERCSVRVWDDTCSARDLGEEAANWFSRHLEISCRLVYMPDSSVRQIDERWSRPGERVGFADGFPFLLLSEASLSELNRRLEEPVPMDRFRPNIVISGCEPHAEDRWVKVEINGLGFRVVKSCARCVVVTTDQHTGLLSREPLRTLAEYRVQDGKVNFGQNLVHDGTGQIRVGDEVRVVKELRP